MNSKKHICDIIKYIDKYLDSKISINDISKALNYDRFYIMKTFKKEIGISINVYINKLRVYHSLYSLNNGSDSLLRIAFNHGFYSLEYYSEIFKREISVSPNTYRTMVKKRMITNEVNKNIMFLYDLVMYKDRYIKSYKSPDKKALKLSIFK